MSNISDRRSPSNGGAAEERGGNNWRVSPSQLRDGMNISSFPSSYERKVEESSNRHDNYHEDRYRYTNKNGNNNTTNNNTMGLAANQNDDGDDESDENDDIPLSRLVAQQNKKETIFNANSTTTAAKNNFNRANESGSITNNNGSKQPNNSSLYYGGGANSMTQSTSAAGSPSSLPVAVRGSDLRDLLLNTEREMAELREECSLRGSEATSLKAALQREHEQSLRITAHHQRELDDLRDEYERQQGQLVEQVTVLKGLCESALQDKHRVADDAQKAKISLLNLIEKEREEKAQVMAEYRTHTETLIAEQGREVTGLRQLLEMARTEEDKLLAIITTHESKTKELEAAVLKKESVLSEERVATQRRIRDLEQRHAHDLQAEKDRSSAQEQSLRSEILRLSTTRDTQSDAVRSLNERIKILEAQFESERRRLKESYQQDVARATEEARAAKERLGKETEAHRREVDTLHGHEESVTASLRRSLDALRAEKAAEAEEQRLQREVIASELNSKTTALKGHISGLERELGDEKSARREAESKLKTLQSDREALQSSINRLTAELEEAQVSSRTRERSLEQDHLHALNAVRDELREADSDNAQLRHHLKKVDVELQRLLDDVEAKQKTIEQMRTEKNREREAHRSEMEKLQSAYDDYRRQSTKALDSLHGQRIQLETEVSRLQRLLGEVESRLTAANKQLVDERKALERSIEDGQTVRAENSDLRSQLDRSNKMCAELSGIVGEKEETMSAQNQHISEMSDAMQAAKEMLERERAEARRRSREYEETISNLQAAARLQMEKAETELHNSAENLRLARETISSLEQTNRNNRDEIAHWQRECSNKDEAHGDALRQLRYNSDEELNRMDDIINRLREDLAKAQQGKSAAQREVSEVQRDADRRVAIVQEALETERHSKLRLHDELRNKEQLNAELNGTLRLINARLVSKDDEIHRLEQEVSEQMRKLHDVHSSIGKKDAIIGQLNAKVRIFESQHNTSLTTQILTTR